MFEGATVAIGACDAIVIKPKISQTPQDGCGGNALGISE